MYKFTITPFLFYLIVTVAIKLYLNLPENVVLFFVFGTRRIVCSFFLLCALNENIISCKCLHSIVKTKPSIINSSSCDRKKVAIFFFLTFLNFYLVEFYYCVVVFVNNLVDFIGNFIFFHFVHFFSSPVFGFSVQFLLVLLFAYRLHDILNRPLPTNIEDTRSFRLLDECLNIGDYLVSSFI